jgi:hypothetical protein
MTSGRPGSNVFLVILVGRHRRRHGPQHGKRPARARHDDCERMRGHATPHPGQGSRVHHRRLTHEAARTVTTQAGNLPDQRRNGRPRPRHRGLPRQTEHAHGGRLSSRGRSPETASAMRLKAQARQNRHAPYPGTGRNRCKGDVFHDAFNERGQGQRPPTRGSKRVSRLGAGVAANVRRPFPTILLVSRSRDRRNETRRPLMSVGYARLKPNPVGQQRLHSTIFPFGPQE